jgi:hypothetical protein
VKLKLDENSSHARFNPSSTSGIAVLRLPAKPSHDDLLTVCASLLRALEHEHLEGKLWSVERARMREYHPAEPDDA